MDIKTYYVVNDNDDTVGFDLTFAKAQEVLKRVQERDPDAGWKIMESKDLMDDDDIDIL